MAFKAPNKSAPFIETVFSRAQALIDIGIWDIAQSRLTGWLEQFTSDDEKYFAACLVDSLIFRSEAQFNACAKALFRGRLRRECTNISGVNSDLDLLTALQSRNDPGIRIVPVIGSDAPPTKSGPLVLRQIKRALEINEDWMIWPWAVEKKLQEEKSIKTIIFVDDFLGSGNQFNEFINTQNLPTEKNTTQWIYAPIIAHEIGVAAVAGKQTNIKIIAAEYLTKKHGFFDESRWQLLSGGAITANDALEFYRSLVAARKIPNRGCPILGYGELALAFGFSHSTPNNSLPILWAESSDWSALLER